MGYNALTIDVEDWFHVCGAEPRMEVPRSRRQVLANMERILALLDEFRVQATFFVLGSVAEQEPALVPRLVAAGHEVASHGYSHTLVPQLGQTAFRDEVRRTGEIIATQGGVRPVGFRAPQWSLSGRETPWAFDVLREEGYRYDSSLSPLPFVGDRQGKRLPHLVKTRHGDLVEVPPLVSPSPFGNLPTGGGWGFRTLPLALIAGTMGRLNREGHSAVLYLHPREMDPAGPRLPLSRARSFVVYGPRRSAEGRLRYLLERFSFAPLGQLVEQWHLA